MVPCPSGHCTYNVQCTYIVRTVGTMYVHCTYSARWGQTLDFRIWKRWQKEYIHNLLFENKSTVDNLVHFETFVREGFLNGEHVVTTFFNLEKAYDTTSKSDFIKDLYDMDLKMFTSFYSKL